MSNIEGFQMFQTARAAAAGSNNSSPSEGKLISPLANMDIVADHEISSSTPSMHIEATQQDAEETRLGGRSGSSTSEITEAWGLLRQQSADRKEYELHHRVEEGRRDTYSIGRSSKCDITVSDSWVSTNHCLIYCDFTQPKMRVFIEDCSVNGTYINHALTRLRKGERVELRSGDEIFLLNPRKPENAAKTFASFVFINLLERVMAFRQISIAPARTTSTLDPAQSRARNATAGPNAPSSQVSERHSQHIEEKYIIGDQIGSGMSGQVYACINKMTSEQFAVKIIDTRKFSLNPGLSVADLREEAVLMQQFDHPNIIRVVDTFQTASMIYIVMELLRGGDLFDRIIEKERYSEESARQLMVQVLSAVAYLHGKQIIHRDLKPENILLVSAKSDVEVKVTDFGLAKKANREGLKTFCGTPQYFAPEVLQRKNNGSGSAARYGTAVDMWSLGVILYILLSGTFPFNDDDEILRAQYSLSGIEWTGVSPGAKHLIRSLMTLRADQRYSVQQALKHPWIQGIPYVPSQLAAIPTSIGAATAEAGGASTVASGGGGFRTTGVRFVEASASGEAPSAAASGPVPQQPQQAPVITAGKKRQASTAPVNPSIAGGSTAAPVAKQTSVSKKSNLRRGNSLFAPLELKIKSSQEYSTTASTSADAAAEGKVITANTAQVVPVARTPSIAPDRNSKVTPAKAPSVRASVPSHPFTSTTTTTPLTPAQFVAAASFLPNLASCMQRRTPPDLSIDLTRHSHSSCVQTPTPNKSIIHLTVTNSTSCLDSLRVPLFSPAVVPLAASDRQISSSGGAAVLAMPPAPAFKRATSFDNSTMYTTTTVPGVAINAANASAKTADKLWEELSYRAEAPGKNECIDPYDDAIEDYSSDEEDGQGQWGNKESAEIDAGGAGADTGSARVHKRKNKPNKSIVKAARPAKAYTAKSAIAGGCLKKPAAAQSKAGESAQSGAGATSVRPQGRQKRSVSFSEELSIVGDVSIASAAAAALITPTAEEASTIVASAANGGGGSSIKKRHIPGLEVSAKVFSFDAMEGLGFEKVRIGGDSPDAAPSSSNAGIAPAKPAPGPGESVVRVVTPKAADCEVAATKLAGGGTATCAEEEKKERHADAVALQTKVPAPEASLSSAAAVSSASDGKKQLPESASSSSVGRKTIGIKRTQSSLEQAWKLKQGAAAEAGESAGAVTGAGKVVRNENVLNDCGVSSGVDAEGALLYPAGKKLRVPMKSLTELFRASSTK